MKIHWLLAVVILMLNISAHAQQFRRFSAGVYGGTQLYGKIYSDANLSKMSGFTAGVDLGIRFQNNRKGFHFIFNQGLLPLAN